MTESATIAPVRPSPVRRKMPPDQRRKEKRATRPALTLSERERLRVKTSRVTCSIHWEDHAVSEADAQGIQPHSTAVIELLAKFSIYPPAAEHTPMRACRCPNCRGVRLWPDGYVRSGGVSFECYLEMNPPPGDEE